jgi:hypothetical protein
MRARERSAVFLAFSMLSRMVPSGKTQGCIASAMLTLSLRSQRLSAVADDEADPAATVIEACVHLNSFQREIVDRAVLSLKDAGVPSFLIE